MKFKVGDVIVSKLYSEKMSVFLILEVDHLSKISKIFVLKHTFKDWIGQKYTLNFENLEHYTTLKDKPK